MLSFVDSYKYLGVIMLSCFMDDDDIKRQVRALYLYTREFSGQKFLILFS